MRRPPVPPGWPLPTSRCIEALTLGAGAAPAARSPKSLKEARVLSQPAHPNICRIFDFLEENGIELLVLEFIDGQSLAKALRKGIPLRDLLPLAAGCFQEAEALFGRCLKMREKVLGPPIWLWAVSWTRATRTWARPSPTWRDSTWT